MKWHTPKYSFPSSIYYFQKMWDPLLIFCILNLSYGVYKMGNSEYLDKYSKETGIPQLICWTSIILQGFTAMLLPFTTQSFVLLIPSCSVGGVIAWLLDDNVTVRRQMMWLAIIFHYLSSQ